MHECEELFSMWGPDIPHIDPSALRHFTIAALRFVALGLLCKYVLVPEQLAVPRQYPFDNLVKELGGLEENKVGCLSQALIAMVSSTCPPLQANIESPEEYD